MIAQARITSATHATVHLENGELQLEAPTLSELRTRIKKAFIEAARSRREAMDVLIVEPDRRHHLRVEPSGRISGRAADDRPVLGPDPDATQGTDAAASIDATGPTGSTPTEGSARPEGIDTADAGAPQPESAAPGFEDTAVLRPVGSRRRHAAPHSPSAASAPTPVRADEDASPPAATLSDPGEQEAPAVAEAPSLTPSPDPVTEPTAAPASEHTAAPATGPAAAPATDPPAAPASATGTVPTRPGPEARALPTLEDLRSTSAPLSQAPATRGLPGLLHRVTRGRISPAPNAAEKSERADLARVRRDLSGPRNIVVVNLKGGAHKTTASLMIAATLGVARGGSVLAWDNNETRGTLGWRGVQGGHHRTALDLLRDLDELTARGATVSDLDRYVRHQGETRFDILASDEDAGSMASMDGTAFDRLNEALSRFYRVKVVDTGNNVRASNWLAAVGTADQLVIISTVREDTFNAAAWMIDELRATGFASTVDQAVTILSHSSTQGIDPVLHKRLVNHFGAHTRAVHEVPFEKQFVDGGELDWSRLSPATTRAWLSATAAIVDGL